MQRWQYLANNKFTYYRKAKNFFVAVVEWQLWAKDQSNSSFSAEELLDTSCAML